MSPARIGAVHFLTPTSGVALTAPPPAGCAGVVGPSVRATAAAPAVRLATSNDGGRRWVTTGAALPVAGQMRASEQIVATTTRDLLALVDTGGLFASHNGGRTWTRQPLPSPVVDVGLAGRSVVALACPRAVGRLCRPVVEWLTAKTWKRMPIPALRADTLPRLTVASPRAAAVVVPGNGGTTLLTTVDAGKRWIDRPAPRGPGNLCTAYEAVAATGPVDLWLLCTGGAAAGSSTKALMHSTNAGRTWTVAAAVTSLTASAPPGSLPRADGVAIAAAAPDRLWLAAPNDLTESDNGGVRWLTAAFNAAGGFWSFDVLDPRTAWLTAPGVGLWGTTDGTTWVAL